MTNYYLPRVMTSPELAYIRSESQSSMIYMGIDLPPAVYTARVNQTFTSLDKVVQVTYDGGSGTLANVLSGMTMYVGSIAGASDLGMCRIRKTPSGTLFYIGENSEIPWVNDLYLTVVDDFNLWARHINIVANVPYMDYDIAYSDQHTNTSPIPIVGPRFVPVWLAGATVVVPFNAALSYCLPGTTVASYLWTAPGASATSGLTTATPSITYSAVGRYRVSCKVTAANGKYTTAYIIVRVYDRNANLPITQFDLKSCNGSSAEGGWKFQVTMWSQADLSLVVDRAMVVLFARDFYNTTEISIGQIANRENILAIGWISGESIVEDPDGSSVEFSVETAQSWMKKISGFPIGIQNTTIAADAWTNWQGLTVDASLYHHFLWQSTIIPVVDVFLTGDSKYSPEQYAVGDTTLSDQLTYLLKNTLLGSFGCDRFNRLFCEVDTQLTHPADRSVFPIILTLEKIDWRDKLQMIRTPIPTTSQVNLSGVSISLTSPALAIFSLAPGHVYNWWGRTVKQDRMLLSTQALANELAALKLAWDNKTYEFSPDLAGNNRMLDVYPSHQFVAISVADIDTPRGFVFNGNMVIREINMSLEKTTDESGNESNFLQISWRGENEVFPGNSTNGDLPGVSTVPSSDFPPVESYPVKPLPPYIAVAPPNPETLDKVVVLVAGVGMFYTKNFSTKGITNWYAMNDGLSSPSTVVAMDVTNNGRVYCQQGLSSIWTAAYPGATWVELFNTGSIGNPESFPFPRGPIVTGFGVNRNVDDEVFITGGLTVSIFGQFVRYNWKGSSSGVSLVTFNTYGDTSPQYHVSSVLRGRDGSGNGTWAVRQDAGVGTYSIVYTFASGGGAPITGTAISGAGGWMNKGRYGTTGLVANTNDPLATSIDNGASFTSRITAPAPYQNESVAPTSDGLKILVGKSGGGVGKSSDSGATWGTAPMTAAAVWAMWNLGTDLDWLFSFVGEILYTPDAGNTFVYKTGDLKTWAGALAHIISIRHIIS